ncbi:MAG: DUF1993 family protein [Steroidobacteraceae bacterium]
MAKAGSAVSGILVLYSATAQGSARRGRFKQEEADGTSLYDLSVPTFLQTVKAVGGFLGRAARHCAETGADPNDFVHARLFDDMAPFHFQYSTVDFVIAGFTAGIYNPSGSLSK